MNDISNNNSNNNGGQYQVPPTVQFVPPNGFDQAQYERYMAAIAQTQQVPQVPQQAPQVAPPSMPGVPWQQQGRSIGLKNLIPGRQGQPSGDRPAWFWLAMAGIPSGALVLTTLAVVIGMNSGGAVQKSSMAGMTAVAMEATKQRGDVVCVSWSCDKFAQALGQESGSRYVQSGTMDVRWGDAQATFSADPQQQQQSAVPSGSTPVSAPEQFSVIATTAPGASVWQDNKVVNTIPNGDRVKVLRRDGDWVLVNWVASGDFIGWVKAVEVR